MLARGGNVIVPGHTGAMFSITAALILIKRRRPQRITASEFINGLKGRLRWGVSPLTRKERDAVSGVQIEIAHFRKGNWTNVSGGGANSRWFHLHDYRIAKVWWTPPLSRCAAERRANQSQAKAVNKGNQATAYGNEAAHLQAASKKEWKKEYTNNYRRIFAPRTPTQTSLFALYVRADKAWAALCVCQDKQKGKTLMKECWSYSGLTCRIQRVSIWHRRDCDDMKLIFFINIHPTPQPFELQLRLMLIYVFTWISNRGMATKFSNPSLKLVGSSNNATTPQFEDGI